MIIWSRWGIVVLAFFGLGVGLGFILMGILGITEPSGARNGTFVGLGLMISGVLLWLFNKYVVGQYIDKPKPAYIWEQLAEPVTNANGQKQTHRALPVRHPETGQHVMTNPVSTFFFIPIRIWAVLLPAIGLVIFAINLLIVLAGGR